MAFSFRREGLHQPHNDQPADDRRQDHERPPRIGGVEVIGVVNPAEGAEEEGVVDDRDHGAEEDRAEGGDNADDEGEHDQGGQADGPRFALKFGRFGRRGGGRDSGIGHGSYAPGRVGLSCTLGLARSRIPADFLRIFPSFPAPDRGRGVNSSGDP